MPQLASFPVDFLETVFRKFGIYLLETFDDGQTRWGNKPLEKPYTGRSTMANPYTEIGGKKAYDIFTIRMIADRLGKADQQKQIVAELDVYFSRD